MIIDVVEIDCSIKSLGVRIIMGESEMQHLHRRLIQLLYAEHQLGGVEQKRSIVDVLEDILSRYLLKIHDMRSHEEEATIADGARL